MINSGNAEGHCAAVIERAFGPTCTRLPARARAARNLHWTAILARPPPAINQVLPQYKFYRSTFHSVASGTIIRSMSRAACLQVLLGVTLAVAQEKFHRVEGLPTASKLHATLLALREPPAAWRWDAEKQRVRPILSYQLADEIMSLADSDGQPSRATVTDFTDELTKALIGKSMTDAQALLLEASIDAVLRSTGATFRTATHLRETLATIGVDASKLPIITKRFIVLGEEVRGPEDLPVRPHERAR